MMNAGKAFFGTDKVAFDITNANATRSYTRFTGYVHDAIDGRILIGFHFRTADEQGAWHRREDRQLGEQARVRTRSLTGTGHDPRPAGAAGGR